MSCLKWKQEKKALDAYYALQQKVSDAASNDNESLAGAEEAAGVKRLRPAGLAVTTAGRLNFKPVSDAIFNSGLVGERYAGQQLRYHYVDGDRAFVLRVSEHKPEAVKPLAEVKDQVVAQVKHSKANSRQNWMLRRSL